MVSACNGYQRFRFSIHTIKGPFGTTYTYKTTFWVCSPKCRLRIDLRLQIANVKALCEFWHRTTRPWICLLWCRLMAWRSSLTSKHGIKLSSRALLVECISAHIRLYGRQLWSVWPACYIDQDRLVWKHSRSH